MVVTAPTSPPKAPHRRYDALSGRWVLVSPHRAQRPWLGQSEAPAVARPPSHDPTCHLCPGVARASGQANPDYRGVYAFDNDFPALLESVEDMPTNADPLFAAQPATGVSRVICYSPDHSRAMADLEVGEIEAVVAEWVRQSVELGARFPSVQVFENKGAAMGASNPHPHGQVWATSYVPTEVAREDATQRDWLAAHGAPMLAELAAREAADGARVVFATDRWLAVVPFWAAWPFEVLLLPRFDVRRLSELPRAEHAGLAQALKRLTRTYDALFGVSFPYSMGWHGAPNDGEDTAAWRLHAHVYPPLLRSATVRKFMVGFELLAEVQRDLTPEQAAERLRAAGAAL